MSAGEAISALTRHPRSRSDALEGLEVRVCRIPGGMLTLTYTLSGDIARVRVPPAHAPRRADALWRHTCCEAFLRHAGHDAYHELNFSPSGEWAAYAFDAYREGMRSVEGAGDPKIAVRTKAGSLELEATIALDSLAPGYAHARLAVALSAVVEADDGSLSYWALAHPTPQPDFHHRDAFALVLVPLLE